MIGAEACALRGSTTHTSVPRGYCGRPVDLGRDFYWTDVAYAVRHYRGAAPLRLCEACASMWEKESESSGEGQPR